MATNKDVKWRLEKLKEAIGRSNDVENEFKDLLNKVTIENIVGAGIPTRSLPKEQVFDVYQMRYRIIESKGEVNISFANLLMRLKEIDSNLHLIITGLRTEGKLYLVFTDEDYHTCFGIIY